MNRNDFETLIERGRVTTLDAELYDAARDRALALRSAALQDTARRLRRRLSTSGALGGIAALLVGGVLVTGGLLFDRDGTDRERAAPVGHADPVGLVGTV